jgi:hypothetical protein
MRKRRPTTTSRNARPKRPACTSTACGRSKHGLRFGAHQLPLMGCGDWNDGMNLVGKDGRGESVWLAWFLLENLELFAGLARDRNDQEFAELCSKRRRPGCAATSRPRPGTATGTGAPISTTAPRSARPATTNARSIRSARAGRSSRKAAIPGAPSQAMTAVDQRLVRRDKQIIQLLDPPFDTSELEPGYIKGYIPGVRENGGQYTHAAIWTTMAFAMMGDTRARMGILRHAQSDQRHGDTPETIATLQGRALRHVRGHLCRVAAHRPRRLDLVHRRGGLDVPADRGNPARPAARSRPSAHHAVRSRPTGMPTKSTTAIARPSITSPSGASANSRDR